MIHHFFLLYGRQKFLPIFGKKLQKGGKKLDLLLLTESEIFEPGMEYLHIEYRFFLVFITCGKNIFPSKFQKYVKFLFCEITQNLLLVSKMTNLMTYPTKVLIYFASFGKIDQHFCRICTFVNPSPRYNPLGVESICPTGRSIRGKTKLAIFTRHKTFFLTV